jgi:hypothetical protein
VSKPTDAAEPALPEPDGYFYEVDGYFGIHRQFDTAPYNGMRPHRTVGYFTADTTRAAIDAAVAEARAVPEGWSISRQENGSIDIRGPGHIAVNVRGAEQSPRLIPTQVLYELAEAMLSATPSPAEQER